MARILIAPIGIVAGLIAGQISKKLFDFIWGRISDEKAPEPDQRELSLPLLATALVLQGGIFRLTKGMVDRGTRVGFQRLTGAWPGEARPDRTG